MLVGVLARPLQLSWKIAFFIKTSALVLLTTYYKKDFAFNFLQEIKEAIQTSFF